MVTLCFFLCARQCVAVTGSIWVLYCVVFWCDVGIYVECGLKYRAVCCYVKCGIVCCVLCTGWCYIQCGKEWFYVWIYIQYKKHCFMYVDTTSLMKYGFICGALCNVTQWYGMVLSALISALR